MGVLQVYGGTEIYEIHLPEMLMCGLTLPGVVRAVVIESEVY